MRSGGEGAGLLSVRKPCHAVGARSAAVNQHLRVERHQDSLECFIQGYDTRGYR
jgi:hypothetical protein